MRPSAEWKRFSCNSDLGGEETVGLLIVLVVVPYHRHPRRVTPAQLATALLKIQPLGGICFFLSGFH